eukprot:4798542-Amphidinium_carterae.1
MGAYPQPDEELMAEQLSCLSKIFSTGRVPYVDFSLFGPFGHRIVLREKLRGVRLGPDGAITKDALHGPKTISDWHLCYGIFKT